MEFPPFLGDYCSAGQHSELPACPTANFCAGELLSCQKHFWDGSAPSHPVSLWWQWAAASGTEPGVEALPAPRGSLWLLHCREEAAGGVYGSDVLFICFLKNRLHKGWAVFLWRARSAWYNQKYPAEKKKKQQTAKAWLGWSRKKDDPCYLWWSTGCPQRWTDQHPWWPPPHLWKANFVKIIPEISREINFKISLLSQNR